jgi:Fic family protein
MNPHDFTSRAPGQVLWTQKDYYAFLPDPLPPAIQWSEALITALSDADRALSRLAGISSTIPNPYILVLPFVRQEAVLSSRIEGTRSNLEDVYKYEAHQLTLLENRADINEVYNYIRALDYGLHRLESLPVSLRLIRELHQKLMENVRGSHLTPGEFRRSQNWIGVPGATIETAAFVPPPVEEMFTALSALELFIHAETPLPLLLKLGLIHYQFEVIHPFLDGNGRIGRLLLPLLLAEWGLLPQPMIYLSGYFEKYRQSYYDLLLAVSQKGAWEAWLAFFLRAVQSQSQQAAGLIARLQAIRREYHQIVASDRAAEKLQDVIDYLVGQPIVSINQILEHTKANNFNAASRYVEKLVQVGILEEITSGKRNRIFCARVILQAIQRTG